MIDNVYDQLDQEAIDLSYHLSRANQQYTPLPFYRSAEDIAYILNKVQHCNPGITELVKDEVYKCQLWCGINVILIKQ